MMPLMSRQGDQLESMPPPEFRADHSDHVPELLTGGSSGSGGPMALATPIHYDEPQVDMEVEAHGIQVDGNENEEDVADVHDR